MNGMMLHIIQRQNEEEKNRNRSDVDRSVQFIVAMNECPKIDNKAKMVAKSTIVRSQKLQYNTQLHMHNALTSAPTFSVKCSFIVRIKWNVGHSD